MNDMSLKAKIRNTARANGIPAQLVLQQYLNERFLVRLSMTNYRDKFVVKGGTLIASIVGLSNRATMDMDTTLKDLPLTPDAIETAINTICSVDTWDGITFKCERLEPIRDDDLYGGYRVLLQADYGKIAAPMSMDVSTGDIITPGAIQREFSTMFDSESFHLWSYNVETILAEKVETILSRNVFSTRPRDFYDLYVLTKTEAFDRSIFQEALNATARHRKSLDKIKNIDELLLLISKSNEQQKLWNKYCEQFSYAQGIEYTEIIRMLTELLADVKVG
jgi:Domain of unknown function (DUF1814).